jgi:predicted metal-dependent phosphoesterase TrpH
MQFADLHIHSCHSDGTDTPSQIFAKAKTAGVQCISITDHDTLGAYEDEAAISALSAEHGVEIIKGIEFSANHGDAEVHLLGYFVDGKVCPSFHAVLKDVKLARQDRMLKIINKLAGLGLKIDIREFLEYMGQANPSRLHLATYMHKKGMIPTVNDAFRNYIGTGKPAYVNRFLYDAREAIALLKKSGARVCVAHPVNFKDVSEVEKFAEMGIDGVEVFYPTHSDNLIMKYSEIVQKHRLLSVGGSDYHGSFKEGTAIGNIKLPYDYVEALKAGRKHKG